MRTRKVIVQLDQALLQRSENLARQLRANHDSLVGMAIEEFVTRREQQRTLRQLNSIYSKFPLTPRSASVLAQHRRIIADLW